MRQALLPSLCAVALLAFTIAWPLATAPASGNAQLEIAPPELTLEAGHREDGVFVIRKSNETNAKLKIKWQPPTPAADVVELTLLPPALGYANRRIDLNGNQEISLTNKEVNFTALEGRGPQDVKAIVRYRSQDTDDLMHESQPLRIEVDTVGPLLLNHQVIGTDAVGYTLELNFRDDDLIETLSNETEFMIQPLIAGPQTEALPLSEDRIDGDTVRLFLGRPPVGTYKLTISNLTDGFENPAGLEGEGIKLTFAIAGADVASTGDNVEFPEFLPPLKPELEPFNPSAKVETRVVQLYYFRDAHRVAQLINRTTQSYNHVAVDQAERLAEEAREQARQLTRERKAEEREAVRAASEARQVENQLQEAYRQLRTVEQIQAQAEADDEEPASEDDDDQVATEEDPLQERERDLRGTINKLETELAGLRSLANEAAEQASRAEALEDEAVADAFRLSVAAAKADPDTYAPAKTDSVDPVMQVSVSVIGEGVLQLRGPIKGINIIRRAISQIDRPLGQIKVGVYTVQINGERGERMEKVAGEIEAYIDLSRFLTSKSLMLLRNAIQSESARIANECNQFGHTQTDRDRRYLYAFFGRDFIDELYAIESEFLNTENKVLSLHSMDTVSLQRALFILALARNDVRQAILANFWEAVQSELPLAEYEYRLSSELHPVTTIKRFPPWNRARLSAHDHEHKKAELLERVHRNAADRYRFQNFMSFFGGGPWQADTLNPVQREFIRLAQIFKARLVAEMELKQRVVERGLIEREIEATAALAEAERQRIRRQVLEARANAQQAQVVVAQDLPELVLDLLVRIKAAIREGDQRISRVLRSPESTEVLRDLQDEVLSSLPPNSAEQIAIDPPNANMSLDDLVQRWRWLNQKAVFVERDKIDQSQIQNLYEEFVKEYVWIQSSTPASDRLRNELKEMEKHLDDFRRNDADNPEFKVLDLIGAATRYITASKVANENWKQLASMIDAVPQMRFDVEDAAVFEDQIVSLLELMHTLQKVFPRHKDFEEVVTAIAEAEQELSKLVGAIRGEIYAEAYLVKTKQRLDHKKLLDFLIDEQEEKFIELVDGTKQNIAAVDAYLKRLSVALEDDFKIQFYDPAFARIREAARAKSVELGQIEKTTVLTNNRVLAAVLPTATMEFDLPKRDIVIVEALEGAKAVVQDYGALLNDPTFLAAFQMLGGGPQPTEVRNVLPGLGTQTDAYQMGIVPREPVESPSALQRLVPDPAIYKFETGTGFEIRPVIQPDGNSVVYDFEYMYTTRVREPVDADEKHLGRIKRHFINTQVQTSNFEMREISRYQVALKAARITSGVPLLEDIPIAGALFRPAPSESSSLQQNIIIGYSTVYPTVFDLMGLRWAPHVTDLNHISVRDSEHVVRGRREMIESMVFEEASQRVDEALNIPREYPQFYRPDLYHRQLQPSPYHPSGFRAESRVPFQEKVEITDPTGHQFTRPDRRPLEYQEPPYDPKFRRIYEAEEYLPEAPTELQPPVRLQLQSLEHEEIQQ